MGKNYEKYFIVPSGEVTEAIVDACQSAGIEHVKTSVTEPWECILKTPGLVPSGLTVYTQYAHWQICQIMDANPWHWNVSGVF